jgi:predicted O-methyltransferase YrrM
MSLHGTQRYENLRDSVPLRVRSAVEGARRLEFGFCVRPEIGRLLAVLAGGLPAGARVGETGTGTGAGLAWMVDAARDDVAFVSIEQDTDRVAVARTVFADRANVEIVHGDSATIVERGPFDLLVLDGAPGSGKGDDVPVDPASCLVPGGLVTVDDFTPMSQWPPVHDGEVDAARVHWLTHPALDATEIRVAPDLAVVVGRRRHGTA